MTIRTTLITTGLIAASLVSGAAQAALQGRDLNGSAGSFEAYYDTVLDITWLADADYAKTSGYDADGYMTWTAANTWAANLSFTAYPSPNPSTASATLTTTATTAVPIPDGMSPARRVRWHTCFTSLLAILGNGPQQGRRPVVFTLPATVSITSAPSSI